MALIQVNYLSKVLFRTVPVNVILPVDKIGFDTLDYLGVPDGGYPTLYLLHGLLGNYTDWVAWHAHSALGRGCGPGRRDALGRQRLLRSRDGRKH